MTLLIAEKYARCGAGGSLWGRSTPDLWQPTFAAWSRDKFQWQPTETACNPRLASTPYSGGINACLADGSVRNISPSVSAATWWAACTPSGRDLLEDDW